MDNDTNKNTCARCSKMDCAQCVEKDGKNFCCQTCCGEYKKEKEGKKSAEGGSASGGKDVPVNVCRFC